MRIYKNKCDSCGNLSLDKHSADFGIFGASQTASLVSAPKIPKNNESHTENPSVVLKNKLNRHSERSASARSEESKKSSLREVRSDSWQNERSEVSLVIQKIRTNNGI